MSTGPTVGEIKTAVGKSREFAASELPAEIEIDINNQMEALQAVLGGDMAVARDAARVFAQMSGIGQREYEAARTAKKAQITESRAITVAGLIPTSTENAAMVGYSEEERTRARAIYAEKEASSFSTTTDTFDNLRTDLDARVTAGKITQETADKIMSEVGSKVESIVKGLQDEIEQGTLSTTDLQTRISAITNPDIQASVQKRFSTEISNTQLDNTVSGVLGGGTAEYDAAMTAAGTPEKQQELITALNVKIDKRASMLRKRLESGGLTIDQVYAEIDGLSSDYEKNRLKRAFGPELSGRELEKTVVGISDISIDEKALTPEARVKKLEDAMEKLLASPNIDRLPPAIQKAFKEATKHQIARLRGIDDLHVLEEGRFEAESRVRDMEISRLQWERTFRQIRRWALPAGVILALSIGAGSIAAAGTVNVLGGFGAAGLGTFSLFGTAGIGALAAHGINRIYVSKGAVEIEKLNEQIEKKRVESQQSYVKIHDIRASRMGMPLQALTEASKLAAEANWIAVGRDSGLSKEEWVKRYQSTHGFGDLTGLRDALAGLSMMPPNIPLKTSS